MKVTFTDRMVQSLTSKGKPQLEYTDTATTGFVLRVTKDGKKTWNFTFTAPRDQKRARMTLGTYPATSLKIARDAAIAARGKVERGEDPRDEPEEEAPPKTVRELVEDYLKLEIDGQRTADETARRLNFNVVPVVGDVPVKKFGIKDLNKILDPIKARGSLVESNRVLSNVDRMFDFAVVRGEAGHNPVSPFKESLTNEENSRERNLSREEIVAVWQELDAALQKSECVPDILRLCLITVQRVGEIAGMVRSELDMDERVWTIPAARVKNEYTHQVPLSPMAIAIIKRRLETAPGEYLFPNAAGTGSLPVTSIAHTVLRAHKRGAFTMPNGKPMPFWTPHDLRRTGCTQMRRKANGLEISRFTSSLVVNHRTGTKESVTDEVYDQNDYLDEKREALQKWDIFLGQLVSTDKVVPITQARAA